MEAFIYRGGDHIGLNEQDQLARGMFLFVMDLIIKNSIKLKSTKYLGIDYDYV